jgi:peptidyl-prolyl cis-trans isomerase C
MPTASARHILVDTEQKCSDLKQEIINGANFEDVAKHSSCPSSAQGGALGNFSQGQMVPEFDQVVFNDALNVVHGPILPIYNSHPFF